MHTVHGLGASAVVALLALFGIVSSSQNTPKTPVKQTIAFVHATIYTATSDEPIRDGTLVISGDKIVSVGAGDKVTIPADAEKIDLKGSVIIPGLVDTHSHIGLWSKPHVPANSDGNEMSGPVQSGVRAIDAIDINDPGIRMAVAGGITTANIMPGSGNVIGGQTVYVKLRGTSIEEMRILGKDGLLGGLKMANGENPKGYGKGKGQAPFTRMKVAALQREQFQKAKEYMAKMEKDPKTERDLMLEPLVEVLQKKRTVHFHCHRADDLLTAIRISEEFGFELVLQHGTEGYRIADILAKKKIPVSHTIIDSPGGKAETMGLLEENAAVMEKAGVMVAINTDDSVTESRFFLRTGAIAVRGGMSDISALKALTINPAKMMHLDHRLGSLEAGKDADFVVLSGKPFSVYTKVMQTWIEGKKLFDAGIEEQRVYRDGGIWLPREVKLPKFESPEPQQKQEKMQEVAKTNKNVGKHLIYAQRVHTGTGKILHDQMIEVEDGKIKSIQPQPRMLKQLEPGVAVHFAFDVSPGLIDAFTCAGLSGAWNIPADQDQDEISEPNQADLMVRDGFNPQEPLLEFLRSNGITVVHTTPGRAVPIAGRTGVFSTAGKTVETSALNPNFALLVNLGETAKDGRAKGPGTRMGVAGLVRKAFAEAQNPGKAKSAKIEAMQAAVQGKMPVIFSANRVDDIQTALRIAEEFKLKPIIALGTETWRMADELAKKNIPVLLHPTTQRAGSTMETQHTLLATAGVLKQAKVNVVMGSSFEGYVPKNRNLRAEAAMAAVNGLGHETAMQCITLDAAKLLGIDKTHGSIEVGKVADLVLYDGDPFEHATHVTTTIMGGKVVYDREEYLKLPFERRILPLVTGGSGGCCLMGW